MTPDAFYEAFLSILQVHGFVAVPSGDVIKIVPDAQRAPGAGQRPAGPRQLDLGRDRHAGDRGAERQRRAAGADPAAADAAVRPPRGLPVRQHADHLRPRQQREPHDAHHPAHRPAAATTRSTSSVCEHACADRGRARRERRCRAASRRRRRGRPARAVVADDRTNSVLVSGEKSQRLRLRTLVAHLDTPLEAGGDTQVRYLQLRRRREDRRQAQGTDHGHRRSRSAGAPAPAARGAAAAGADRPQHHDLGGAGDQRAGHHRAAEDHALAHGGRRPARHPPRAGAGRGDPGRDVEPTRPPTSA